MTFKRRREIEYRPATVTKIINRDIRSNGIETLTGLAAGLGLSAGDVINIARGVAAKPSRFDMYRERFNCPELSDSELEMLESYFKDHVETWQRFQKERTKNKG